VKIQMLLQEYFDPIGSRVVAQLRKQLRPRPHSKRAQRVALVGMSEKSIWAKLQYYDQPLKRHHRTEYFMKSQLEFLAIFSMGILFH
jgi:hypothetical protein